MRRDLVGSLEGFCPTPTGQAQSTPWMRSQEERTRAVNEVTYGVDMFA